MSNWAIARAVALTALAVVALVALYLARDAILIAYISVVLAIGLGPIVHRIEQAVPKGARALPRWLAILIIYLIVICLIAISGLLVVPPLIEQSQDLWQRAPQLLDQGQDFLIRVEDVNGQSHIIAISSNGQVLRAGPASILLATLKAKL